LPKSLQGWYDGHTTTTNTLPCGLQYRSPAYTLLIYNPAAFRGRALEFTNADGVKQYVNDIIGTALVRHDWARARL
jgi:hypothetical protein